jgi:hypothetical protein
MGFLEAKSGVKSQWIFFWRRGRIDEGRDIRFVPPLRGPKEVMRHDKVFAGSEMS